MFPALAESQCKMPIYGNSATYRGREQNCCNVPGNITAIFDLGDSIDARRLDLLALLGGEFRAEDEGPVVEPLANDVGAELVGGGL
jgi:hypothetical protein